MKRTIALALACLGLLLALPTAKAGAQSQTYLHLEYAQNTCHSETHASAVATLSGTLGGVAVAPNWYRLGYIRYNNNTLDVVVQHVTSLYTYALNTTCRVTGADVYNWVTGYGHGYVYRT